MTIRARAYRALAGASVAALAACAPAAPPAAAPAADLAAVDPTSAPPPLADRPIHFPEFHESRLENGLRLIVVPHGTQPVANLSLYVLSGTTRDPAEQVGRAGLTAELLTKGTATRAAEEISETIEGIGGSLSASAGNDWSSISAGVLSEHVELAFELLGDVVLRPTFPADELELARRRTLSALQASLGQPSSIADRRFRRELYGEHPYGASPIPGTVQAIQRDDLVDFHREHFTADNAVLVVSGDVRPDIVESLARRHFAEWRSGAAAAPRLGQAPARDETRIYLVHRPGSVQSTIQAGHLGIRPDTPDFFALQVLNRVLGGGSDSRLFQILREEKGWTYAAYSGFTRPQDVGYFVASAEVRTEVTDSAVVELMRQLRRIRDEPVPAAEFEAAKSYLMGSFPLRLQTASGVASQVAQIRLLGLPDEHLTEYRERIAAVTPDDVLRAAQRHVRPDQTAIVVVGDAAQLLPVLEPIAPIVLYDVQGQPIERDAIGE
jgi:zinc protease